MRQHTPWCARAHHCNLGDHRSAPVTVRTDYGSVVLTRVQTRTGAQRVEARLSVTLDADPARAIQQSRMLAVSLDAATRRALAGLPPAVTG